jgi:hypothetical protein
MDEKTLWALASQKFLGNPRNFSSERIPMRSNWIHTFPDIHLNIKAHGTVKMELTKMMWTPPSRLIRNKIGRSNT